MSTPARAGATSRRTVRGPTRGRRAAPRLLGVALREARHGHYVFPVWPRSKIPAMHGKRRCEGTGVCADGHLGWEQRATLDEDLIRAWWTAEPTCNVGIACGPSNLYVIDLDPLHGEPPEDWPEARHGRDVLTALAERAGQPFPGDTYMVRSPTQPEPSVHLYYAVAETSTLRNTASRAGPGIDSRGRGGFIIAAGSMRPDGVYMVAQLRPIASWQEWMTPLFVPPPRPDPEPILLGDVQPLPDSRRQAYLDKMTDLVANAGPGKAHDTLVRLAYSLGRLVSGGEFTDDEARAALYIGASRRNIPAYEADEAITDGLEAGATDPRRLPNRTRP